MSRVYDCVDPGQRVEGVKVAAASVFRGELVVLPTDTVYGIGCDAFSPAGVESLLRAKGRGRDMPVPVLIGSVQTLDGVATGVGDAGRALIEEFWPGGLTVVCREQPSLAWDLGDAQGTVAVRFPSHEVAVELLTSTGPMAVSSANVTGHPPATTAAAAQEQLGAHVAVYLDGGPCTDSVPSTIVDLTGERPRVLRVGAIPLEELRRVAPEVEGAGV